MKLALLSTITVHFLAAYSALAADDASPVIPDSSLLGSEEAAYPAVLADVTNKGSYVTQGPPVVIAHVASNSLPDYCFYDPAYNCYKHGIPKCCIRSRLRCNTERPSCDIRRQIDAGGVCQARIDRCRIRGYSCIDGRCAARAATPVRPNGVCRLGLDNCTNGYVCVNGRCSSSSGWYTNWSYCIMDCPSTAGSCCGGTANSWDQVYTSVDQCCNQTALAWNKDACVRESLSCVSQDYDGILAYEKSA